MRYLLIVEDEPEIRVALEELFQPPEYEVMSAANGKEATRLIHRNHFDVILTDYKMPWVDGGDFYTRIRKSKGYEDTPVIFITGYMGEISSDILADPLVTVVDKPINFVSLKPLVNEIFKTKIAKKSASPKSKIDIQLIDAFMKSIVGVVNQVSSLETISSMRPFVYKTTDNIVADVIETVRFETVDMNGYFSLVYRNDTYLWLMSFFGAAAYSRVEEAIEDQGGRLSKMVQKALWKRLKIQNAEDASPKFETETLVKNEFMPGPGTPIIVPIRTGFGELHGAIRAERSSR